MPCYAKKEGISISLQEAQVSDSFGLVMLVTSAMNDRNAKDVVVLDMRDVTPITDYFVIATGRSSTHIEAIADALEERLKDEGIRILHKEGTKGAGWVLLDLGGVVVHIFGEREREFYALERLWQDARLLVV